MIVQQVGLGQLYLYHTLNTNKFKESRNNDKMQYSNSFFWLILCKTLRGLSVTNMISKNT